MQLSEHESLASHTTLRVGGPARFFVRASTIDDIEAGIRFARTHALPFFFLGGGSNLLVRDEGYHGVIIKLETSGIQVTEHEETVTYVVEAGESWDAFVARTCDDGCWGLENLSGIPGTVGAAPIQNIGAYGMEIGEVLSWVEVIDTETYALVRFDRTQCQFAYRDSRFKHAPGRYCIVRIACTLSKQPTPRLAYADVAQVFANCMPATPAEVRTAIRAIRARKFPDLTKEGSAGSFFLNPVVSSHKAAALLAQYPALPHYQTPHGEKLSLAWLLDHALALRGYRYGGARLYEKQPLVVVTDHTATADDVCALQKHIAMQAQSHLHISLTPEVRII